jgi:hypothetical protein
VTEPPSPLNYGNEEGPDDETCDIFLLMEMLCVTDETRRRMGSYRPHRAAPVKKDETEAVVEKAVEQAAKRKKQRVE